MSIYMHTLDYQVLCVFPVVSKSKSPHRSHVCHILSLDYLCSQLGG